LLLWLNNFVCWETGYDAETSYLECKVDYSADKKSTVFLAVKRISVALPWV
jgi:hypothetical protein